MPVYTLIALRLSRIKTYNHKRCTSCRRDGHPQAMSSRGDRRTADLANSCPGENGVLNRRSVDVLTDIGWRRVTCLSTSDGQARAGLVPRGPLKLAARD